MTWNPVTGCSKISAGCKSCYAERMAKRLKAMGVERYRNGFRVTLQPDLLEIPLHWREPHIVFVNSMSDLFHERVPDDYIKKVFDMMVRCPQHIFQILTKRSDRLVGIASDLPWTSNIWMGVSVEDDRVKHRISDLKRVPATVRFLSLEPLIGPLNHVPLEGMHWVIVGGESGPGARPMKREWVISIFRQCREACLPFFFKQWGGVRKDLTGRILRGKTYSEMPDTTLRLMTLNNSNYQQLARV
jgi:protein gp37